MTELPDLATLTTFDERLREVPVDRAAVEAAARAAADALAGEPEDPRLLAYLGNAARILGRDDEAIAYLTRALHRVQEARGRAVATIRLGEAHRCAGRLDEAESLLRTAHELTRDHPELEDFALQHLGKCLLDQGRDAEAVTCLERALAVRERKGDAALVASTRVALDLARSRGTVT